jgi:predicted ABC-type transport system involved in lysophospholipase L1 biosynthesis ATPase subunit
MSVLVVSGVSQGVFRGGSWLPLLSDVSFEVERGEVVAIVGGRLSGKTTLLEITAGIKSPERGSVRLGEHELAGMPESKRVRLRGEEVLWLNRAGMSLSLKVIDMVVWPGLGLSARDTRQRARAMLERVGVLDCAEKRWPDLSPWEQLLVGLARAFARRPKLVVIDDLLDAHGSTPSREASRLLRSLIAESGPPPGVLMSVSDRDAAMFANRVWSIGPKGQLIPTLGHTHGQADVVPLRAENGGGACRAS